MIISGKIVIHKRTFTALLGHAPDGEVPVTVALEFVIGETTDASGIDEFIMLTLLGESKKWLWRKEMKEGNSAFPVFRSDCPFIVLYRCWI